MRRWLAAFYKDFCLFVRGSSWLVLLIPFLLWAALQAGLGDVSQQMYVRSFPIAVRDLDETVMSRSLAAQMEQVELFSEIRRAAKEETDEELLAQGMAAVVTIPEDFFYELYTMEDCPVEVTLNTQMKLEASLFRSIFTSVMDIIGANQAAERGLFRFCYGESSADYEGEMYEQAAEQLLRDALGRQAVFDSGAAAADVQGALNRRLLASLTAAVALLFSAAALKTLPEERELMVLPRYRALGGSLAAFLCSKLAITLLLFGAVMLLAMAGVCPEGGGEVLLVAVLILLGAFGMILALSAWTDSGAVQYGSTLFLLLSLVLGGSLWPTHLLPPALAMLSRLTLPYYARLGLELAAQGAGAVRLVWELKPVLIMGMLGGLAAAGGLLRGKRTRGQGGFRELADRPASPGWEAVRPGTSGQGKPRRRSGRVAGLALLKGSAMVRGIGGLLALLFTVSVCAAVVTAAESGGASGLCLVICDQDQSERSRELIERLTDMPGLSLRFGTEQEGRQSLLRGEAEGLLRIGGGYEAALEGNEHPPLAYESASAALSAQGAREIIAGQVVVQRSRLRAVEKAGERLGRPLSAEEEQALMQEIARAEGELSALYEIRTSSGQALAEPFVPGRMSLVSLAVLFTLLTAAPWSRSADGRRVETRMYSLPHGKRLAYASDILALMGIGLLAGAVILIFGGQPAWTGEAGIRTWAALAGYAFCITGISLALVRFTAQEGRVDGLGPFLALVLCLAGGCFMDLSQISPLWARIASVIPPGLALAAGEGSWRAVGLLLAEGALFMAVGRPRRL